MSDLARLQGEFQAYLLGRPSEIRARVKATSKASETTLLDVYREGYWLRLVEVLAHNHPKLSALLGPEDFASLGRAYIAANPSTHANARWYGGKLADFLAAASPWSAKPALAELARFEWLLGEAFDAPDQDALTAASMGALAPEQWGGACFRLHPSLRSLELARDAAGLWQRLEAGLQPEPADWPEPGEPRTWILWRRQEELLTYFRSLDPDEAAALALARAGRDFAAICESLEQWHDAEAAPGRAAAILAQWFADGLIVGLDPAA